jgi:hypothetical protein
MRSAKWQKSEEGIVNFNPGQWKEDAFTFHPEVASGTKLAPACCMERRAALLKLHHLYLMLPRRYVALTVLAIQQYYIVDGQCYRTLHL